MKHFRTVVKQRHFVTNENNKGLWVLHNALWVELISTKKIKFKNKHDFVSFVKKLMKS